MARLRRDGSGVDGRDLRTVRLVRQCLLGPGRCTHALEQEPVGEDHDRFVGSPGSQLRHLAVTAHTGGRIRQCRAGIYSVAWPGLLLLDRQPARDADRIPLEEGRGYARLLTCQTPPYDPTAHTGPWRHCAPVS